MVRGKARIFILMVLFICFGLAEDLSGADDFLDRGVAEYKAGNYEEAFEFLTSARERLPDSSMAAYYLGLTYKQMGNDTGAIQLLMDAIRLTPPVVEAYPELIEIYYHRDELREARDWIRKAEGEGVKPGQISFLKGLVLFKEGQWTDAIAAFQGAKKTDPSLAQSADVHIAMIYARLRRFTQAKESLKAAISVDPSSELASFATEYEEALNKEVKQYKSWRVSAGLAYQYDDNVVLKPSSTVPGVEVTGEKDSSVVTDVRLHYGPLLKEPWIFHATYHSYTNTYFDNHRVNLIEQTITVYPGFNFPRGAVTLPCSYSYLWLREKDYMSIFWTKPTLSFMPVANHIGQFSVGYVRREMLRSPPNRREDRDANIGTASLAYLHPFLGGKGLFHSRYEFSFDETEGRNWENLGNRLNMGLVLPVIDRVSFGISGDALLQDYRSTHTFFGKKRSDRTYTGSTHLRWEILKGFYLNLQYSHTKADSNIAVYEYKRNVLTAGAEYRF